MRKIFIILLLLFVGMLFTINVCGDSIDEFSDSYRKEYKALEPSPNSSVHTDYRQDRIALGTDHTVKILRMIYKQNQDIMNTDAESLSRHNEIIKQNSEIIRLLTILVDKETHNNRLLAILVKKTKEICPKGYGKK